MLHGNRCYPKAGIQIAAQDPVQRGSGALMQLAGLWGPFDSTRPPGSNVRLPLTVAAETKIVVMLS